jgi:hypothetical protein
MTVVPPGGFSLAEFLTIHRYSERTFKALRKVGLAPKETFLPNSTLSRITERDYLAWLELISQPDCQLKEFLRRRDRSVRYGKQAAKSPGHPANMWKKFKAMKLKAAE